MEKFFHILSFFFIFFIVELCNSSSKREPITKYSYNAFVYGFDIAGQPLQKNGCSGAIVSQKNILTAANCLYYMRKKNTPVLALRTVTRMNPYIKLTLFDDKVEQYIAYYSTKDEIIRILANELKVYIGTDQPMKSSPFDVKEVHEHPYYQYGMPYYDLTFIELAKEIFLTRVTTPIKLTTNEAYYAINNSGLLTGYGATEDNETIASRYLHSVRTFIASPTSCDQKSDKDSTQRNSLRNIYNSRTPNERPIFCATVNDEDDGMCKGWHVGSPFTVSVGAARKLIGIVTTPNICSNSAPAIITSVQGIGNWSYEVE